MIAAKIYLGKSCAKHPELLGERYASNWCCVGCQREHSQRQATEHPEKGRQRVSEWRRANPEKVRGYNTQKDWRAKDALRRARKFSNTAPLAPDEVKRIEALYSEARKLTHETGVVHHVDHDVPLCRGGPHHPDNMQVLPATVNLAKGKRTMVEYLAAYV